MNRATHKSIRKKLLVILMAVLIVGTTIAFTSAQRISAATYLRLSSEKKPALSSRTVVNRKKLTARAKKKRQVVQKQQSIVNYFQYLVTGSLKTKKELESTERPLVLFDHELEMAKPGESGAVTPVKISQSDFLEKAPTGPMYGMVNWWCSAAAVYLSYTPDLETQKNFGIYSGDCTNPNAFITGNFDPQRLGVFNPNESLTFTLRNVNPEDVTIIEKHTDESGVCDLDYYRSLGHRDVYAAQFSCDDGYNLGVKDDIQFTVYVFPPNWPDSANTEAVLKRQSSDADKDGLLRKAELLIGTNPELADTDKDTLSDGDEYIAYQTSPLAVDTDGDGVRDNIEVKRKSNPLGPGDATSDQLARWSRLKNTTDPAISDLNVTFGNGTATVSWTTDLSADGIVNWGTTSKYGSHKSDFAFTKSHAITFPVTPGTVYHYAVRTCSVGPNPKCTTTPDLTLETPAPSVRLSLSNLSVNVADGYATVTWSSNLEADETVKWGETTAYGNTANDPTFSLQHAISFPVTSGKTYQYRAQSCTRDALCASVSDSFTVSGDQTISPSAPVISNIKAVVDNGIATVSWTTDIAADGIVNWGATTDYGTYKSDYPFTTSHAISFQVNSNTMYHYAIRGCTATGKCTTNPDATFTTPASDRVAPTISNVTVTFSDGYANVSWTADVSADGIVNWGATTAYGTHRSDYAFTKSHTISFAVNAGTTYHYAIRGCTPTSPSKCTTTADATFTAP